MVPWVLRTSLVAISLTLGPSSVAEREKREVDFSILQWHIGGGRGLLWKGFAVAFIESPSLLPPHGRGGADVQGPGLCILKKTNSNKFYGRPVKVQHLLFAKSESIILEIPLARPTWLWCPVPQNKGKMLLQLEYKTDILGGTQSS